MTTCFNTKLKSFHVILIVSTITLVNTLLLGFIFYMPCLRSMVKWQRQLKPGNEVRDFYIKLPIPLDFRVYFFNISNPEEVKQGEKPILKQIGPYCYDAYKEKINVEDDKDNDTLTYNPYDTYFFNQMRTGDLSQDDYVTILHPLTVGIVNAVATQKPQYLSAVNKALPVIFKENSSIYLTAKVREILFDGVLINCNVKDFSANAVCSQFKGQPAMVEVEKNIYSFSLLGSVIFLGDGQMVVIFFQRNGSIPTRITIHRGVKNAADIGRVVTIDNKTDLDVWPEPECNAFRGTDGWVFPSFLEKEDGIWTVASDLCRSFKAQYVEDLKFHGVVVRKYFADLGDMSSNPAEKCFCPAPEKCLPKGVMDLTKCMKVPLYCTLPHFLRADEKLLQQVEGLSPELERHIIKIYFEPLTGTPMLGQRRIQFNLQLMPIPKVAMMKTVPEALHPILWIEEGVELEGFLLKKVTSVFTLLKLMTFVRYIMLGLSIQGILYGGYKLYQESKSKKVSPVQNGTTESKNHNQGKTGGIELPSMNKRNKENTKNA
nr:PREDICTED: sensory neuron membrane protein 1-like isoform X1 [Tribolium castaneum]|eukprot:XP_015834959.1 PREDICTED: sensory neuron membrane protein 1-like isoform X1 [Tribolium castaneum]